MGILGNEDIEHPFLSVEAKLYGEANFPKTIRKFYNQAKNNAPPGKIPMVCMKEKGKLDDNALVVISFADFKRLIEERKNGNR